MIMGVETSGRTLGLGLLRDGEILGSLRLRGGGRSSRLLPAAADHILELSDLRVGDLQAVAAARGPGSFTGIRIGCAFAAGLARGLGIPAIGVDSLAALAAGTPLPREAIAIPALGARRGAYFTAAYERSSRVSPGDGRYWHPVQLVDTDRRTPEEMSEILGDSVGKSWWIGDGETQRDGILRDTGPFAAVFGDNDIDPAAVAYLGSVSIMGGVPGDPRDLVPHYHRATEVERRLGGGKGIDR